MTGYRTPLSMFLEGCDTQTIAQELGCSEATAYNMIHREREDIRTAAERIIQRRAYHREYYRRRRQENAEVRASFA